jgi:hypothetical protein
MKSVAFRLEALGDQHERSLFRCGEDALERKHANGSVRSDNQAGRALPLRIVEP